MRDTNIPKHQDNNNVPSLTGQYNKSLDDENYKTQSEDHSQNQKRESIREVRDEHQNEGKDKPRERRLTRVSLSLPAPAGVSETFTVESLPPEVEYTDTSYTSGSLESIHDWRTEIVHIRKKRKRKRHSKLYRGSSIKSISSSNISDLTISEESVVQRKRRRLSKKKGKTEKVAQEERYPKFAKPPEWKHMSTNQRDEWMRNRIIQYKHEQEAERLANLAARKERHREERIIARNLAILETDRREVRDEILSKICELFRKQEIMRAEHDYRDLVQLEWNIYIRPNRLPNPALPSELHAYLSHWRDAVRQEGTEEDLQRRFNDVYPILDMIDLFTSKNSPVTREAISNIKKFRIELSHLLSTAVQSTCYNILKDLDKHLVRQSLTTATYHQELKNLELNVWVAIKQLTKFKGDRYKPPPPLSMDFPTLNLHLTLPKEIDASDLCTRVAHTRRDLCSPSSNSWRLLVDWPNKDEDLYTFSVKESEYVEIIRSENEEVRAQFLKDQKEKIRELQNTIKSISYAEARALKTELTVLKLLEPPEILGGVNPRDRICKEMDDEVCTYLSSCIPVIVNAGELNLRQYRIYGGIIYIHMFEMPMQRKCMPPKRLCLSTVTNPNVLKEIHYEADYDPTSVGQDISIIEGIDLGIDQETEAEELPDIDPDVDSDVKLFRRVTRTKRDSFVGKEQLVVFNMMLPDTVIWSEMPTICQWQERKRIWTTSHIFDVKENPDSSVEFRTSNLWPIAFAQLRYHNMPYKDWELKKNPSGKGVLFTLFGAQLTMTIVCVGRAVYLKEVSTSCAALKQHVGNSMTVAKFKQTMQDVGCDIFPDFDAHNYIEGSCVKAWVMEKHLYHAMAFLSKRYNFKFSKWNNQAGIRHIVCQMREHAERGRVNKYKLLSVTPECSTLLKNDEGMQEFHNESSMPDSFYPDLFTLHLDYGSSDTVRKVFKMSYKLTETVYQLLHEIKPCSFC